MKATIDFESRSACSLSDCGSWKYSLDPTTEILCLAFHLPTWDDHVALWHPAMPTLGIEESENVDEVGELWAWIESGGLVEAHSHAFELAIWRNILVPRHGWIDIPNEQRRCSAAKAAAHSLPRALDKAVDALGLSVKKDLEGERTMKRLAKPRRPNKTDNRDWGRVHAPCAACKGSGKFQDVKKDGTPKSKLSKCLLCWGLGYRPEIDLPSMPLLYHESREEMETVFRYCCQDVRAEKALSDALPDLSESETQMYLMDQTINERGFYLDQEAIDVALALIDVENTDLNIELRELTEGAVEKATQREKMKGWLAGEGVDLEDTQAETLDWLLETEETPEYGVLSPKARRAIELMRMLGRSSTSKYERMVDWRCPDGRVHGGLLYHGASTGRWTGKGVQPHNFPKGTLKEPGTEDPANMERLWEAIKEGRHQPYGTTMEVLSGALRGVITATPGRQIYCVDPASKVLRDDLTWATSESLVVGDGLIGFDEHYGAGKGNQRKFRASTVTSVRRISAPQRVRVFTSQGDITVSADHRFLVRQHKHRGGWVEARHLKEEDQIAFLSKPWETDEGREAGYLAGFVDGEGHTSSHRIGWAQKSGEVLLRVCAALEAREFDFCLTYPSGDNDVWKAGMKGGLGEQLRFVGSIRPSRLLPQSRRMWEGRRIWGQQTPIAKVTRIENLPEGDVIAVGTSTHTLITEGFLSHNCADYSAIEARVLLWLAEDEEALDTFRTGADIYCVMASEIYGYPCVSKKTHPAERALGKVAVLGLGYQMGPGRFVETAASDQYGNIVIQEDFTRDEEGNILDPDELCAKRIVDAYRAKFWRVKDMWKDQNDAAILAVQRPGQWQMAGRIGWLCEDKFLLCELPSGRRLAYPDPEVRKKKMPWTDKYGNEVWKDTLSYMGIDAYTRQWQRQSAYGGLLVENQTQACARDIMADAMLRIERDSPYDIILSVHDELLAEADEGVGGVKDFERRVAATEAWADGCPIEAEGWTGFRYRK